MWAIDFIRAFAERPRPVRWLVLRLLGRYARNEFIGMAAAYYRKHGFDPTDHNIGYNLQGMDYHADIDRCSFENIPEAARIIWPQGAEGGEQ